jgi:hypothetical protein
MKKEKIYIAGKISGIEEQAEKTFSFVENQLVLEGFDVVNPMKLPHNHNKSWESYMKECIAALVYCDYIYPIKGFPAYYHLFADGELYFSKVNWKNIPFSEYKSIVTMTRKGDFKYGLQSLDKEYATTTYIQCIPTR